MFSPAPVGSMPGNKGTYLGQAKSLVDYSPGPNDLDFVSLKVSKKKKKLTRHTIFCFSFSFTLNF